MLHKEAVVLARCLPLEVPNELLVNIDRHLIIEQVISFWNKRSEALMAHFVIGALSHDLQERLLVEGLSAYLEVEVTCASKNVLALPWGLASRAPKP